jgi:hypothetical protein
MDKPNISTAAPRRDARVPVCRAEILTVAVGQFGGWPAATVGWFGASHDGR